MSAIPPLTLPHRLRIAREHAGLEQTDLARALGISRNTISRYENGVHTPSRGLAIAWAQTTGVSFEWILGEVKPTASVASFDRRTSERRTRRPTDEKRPERRVEMRRHLHLVAGGHAA